MNYYPHHIGDFRSGTVNLSRLERWIYRDMLDVYYDTERPLPLDIEKICHDIGVRSEDERRIVMDLLRFKFNQTDDGYSHDRCDAEIAVYRNKAEAAKANGKKAAATRGKGDQYMASPGVLYAVRVSPETVKVGITANIKSRLNQLRSKYGPQTVLVHKEQVAHMGDAEADLLSVYEATRSGEELPVPESAQDALISHMRRLGVAAPVASRSHSGSHTNQEPKNQEPKEEPPLPPEGGGLFADEIVVEPSDQVAEVFDHWRSVMRTPRSALDRKRRTAIERALKSFTVAELCTAINGCAKTPHNMGMNDTQTVYNDIELICRNNANIERFMRNDAAPPRPVGPQGGMNKQEQLEARNRDVAQRWAEKMEGDHAVQ